MSFDKMNDKIAITIPRFKLLKSSDGPLGTRHIYTNEPYLVTMAIDSHGRTQPAIHFNTAHYPNMDEGDEVQMLGHGHLVYGPAQPGEWIAVSALVMESDEDVRRAGNALQDIVKTVADNKGIAALLATNPTVTAVSSALFAVGRLIARMLTSDGDDHLIRTQGVFLRDVAVPYEVNRQYRRRNSMAEIDLTVIPLDTPNGQGPQAKTVRL